MEEKKPAGLAITSMVLGIVSLVLSCCVPAVPLLTSIIGLILGLVALGQCAKGTGGGKGMAITGVITSILTLLPTILITFVLGGTLMSSISDYAEKNQNMHAMILPQLLLFLR